jgi:hypothetical protein
MMRANAPLPVVGKRSTILSATEIVDSRSARRQIVDAADTVDDFVVHQILKSPSVSTAFYNSLNPCEF